MHNMNIHETVSAIAAGYRPESAFLAEAAEKLGKPVDEHKWNKAKELAAKELGKGNKDRFYAYTMGIYKKMMGEATADEKDARVQIPYKKGHYQVTFTPKKGEKRIRRIYQGDDMEATFAKAQEEIKKDHPESHGYAIHSPQTDESIKSGEKKMIGEAEGNNPGSEEFGAGATHDEAKEISDDTTREKLETPKDEADEKKGGPAELAADLRVSIRIERMSMRRYEKMLDKHELSNDDEKWLKEKVEHIKSCIKDMEDKLPELEKEANRGEIKESFIKGIKTAILEIAKG